MATLDLAWQQALDALRHEQTRPASAERQASNRRATQRVRAFRAQLASIAPDTTGDYVREIRQAAEAADATGAR